MWTASHTGHQSQSKHFFTVNEVACVRKGANGLLAQLSQPSTCATCAEDIHHPLQPERVSMMPEFQLMVAAHHGADYHQAYMNLITRYHTQAAGASSTGCNCTHVNY
jgi:hypothetical protein